MAEPIFYFFLELNSCSLHWISLVHVISLHDFHFASCGFTTATYFLHLLQLTNRSSCSYNVLDYWCVPHKYAVMHIVSWLKLQKDKCWSTSSSLVWGSFRKSEKFKHLKVLRKLKMQLYDIWLYYTVQNFVHISTIVSV